ncbi:pyridoxal-dependent decarboxylase [Streptomyces sp. NPDC093109]|uniref:pyridoxal phosphate-dependent decarboxylase family protein n=1 Tax=Streptomyces sp. NPDC093109 TaxID=3154977 RepID=UPI00344EDAA5
MTAPLSPPRANAASSALLGDWSPEELRDNGRRVLDLLCAHQARLRSTPVEPDVHPDTVRGAIDSRLPDHPQDFTSVLDDTWHNVLPHLTLWNHPSFHAYVSTSSCGPAVLAETVTAALNVNALLWRAGPAVIAVEDVVLRWLAELAGYPTDADGVLTTAASLSTLYALTAARECALAPYDVRRTGLTGHGIGRLRIYTSDQAHSSIDRAAMTLGIGLDNTIRLNTGPTRRLDPATLDEALRRDRATGHLPVAVIATAGTTPSGAFDPVPELAAVCARHDVWLHVDGAYGALWNAEPRLAGHLPDLSAADSLVVNPQKCLYTPMDASALYCRHPGVLANTFRLVPEILRTDSGQAELMDRSLQLGRSFRALKIWWTLRTFGRTGIAARMAHSRELAARLRDLADATPAWDIVAHSPLPLLCLRYIPPGGGHDDEATDRLNARILSHVNKSGRASLSHAVLHGTYVIRVSIGNIHTTEDDIDALWTTLQDAARHCTAHP